MIYAPFFPAASPPGYTNSAPGRDAVLPEVKGRGNKKTPIADSSANGAFVTLINCARLFQTALILYMVIVPLKELRVNDGFGQTGLDRG
jgi:hypothetical protein